VRNDVVFSKAVIDLGFEDLDFPFRDLGPAEPSNQFLALAAEHAAGDHFDPTGIGAMLRYVHRNC